MKTETDLFLLNDPVHLCLFCWVHCGEVHDARVDAAMSEGDKWVQVSATSRETERREHSTGRLFVCRGSRQSRRDATKSYPGHLLSYLRHTRCQ